MSPRRVMNGPNRWTSGLDSGQKPHISYNQKENESRATKSHKVQSWAGQIKRLAGRSAIWYLVSADCPELRSGQFPLLLSFSPLGSGFVSGLGLLPLSWCWPGLERSVGYELLCREHWPNARYGKQKPKSLISKFKFENLTRNLRRYLSVRVEFFNL